MSTHELVLLSSFRFPAQYAMTMSDEDMASWLNGWTVLWHPAILWQAKSLPRSEATYDHEQPKAGTIYALPEFPPAYLPDDWEERVRQVGSVVFRATPDRETTLANLKTALETENAPRLGWKEGLTLSAEIVGPFFGLAWGQQLLAALSEAMEHENLLDGAAFLNDLQHAISLLAGFPYTPAHSTDQNEETKPEDWRSILTVAAARLMSAREVLYPVAIHLLNAYFLDETTLEQPWPAGLEHSIGINVIADSATLEKLQARDARKFDQLKTAIANGTAEVCGGSYLEREDPILSIDSQLWNLKYGLERAKELLGTDIRVYARKRFGYHPHLPLFLSTHGLTKALFLAFEEASGLPHYASIVVSWPSPDGKQVDAFVRPPKYADAVETFFNLGHFWFKTTREDHAATIFIMHRDKPAAVWHDDLMQLARLGPVLGKWTTFSRFLAEVMPSEFPATMTADDFHFDFLSDRITAKSMAPVSAFAQHMRTRRRIDGCWTYAALHRALGGARDALDISSSLEVIEKLAETTLTIPPELNDIEKRIAGALAERLQARAAENQPGYMILNPCGFARRSVIELDGARYPLPLGGVVKSCQLDAGKLRAVIEVPALGFAWLPREGPPGTPPMTSKMRLADATSLTLRNEHFEVEIDPASGGLKAIRDHKTRINRLGQMLVFNPGSRMVAKETKVTCAGPALGEIVSEGILVGEQDQVLASFRQRFRAWLGRPLLEMRIEVTPHQPPAGYGWHAYFGARFAWRDERAVLVRGFNGVGYVTTHPRPQTPDYLDIRTPPQNTTIFTGGLPFHQRQGGRMADVILVPEGEKETAFELGIALDRELPMQTAWGYTSPLTVVPTLKGPPHIGASGWLFHIDASNLLLMRITPGTLEPNQNAADAITARFLECANYSGLAEFRCVRDPVRATILGAGGQFLLEANRSGDTVHLEVSPNDLVHVQVEFS